MIPPVCSCCGVRHETYVPGPLAVAVQAREDARRVREGMPASFRTRPGRWTR